MKRYKVFLAIVGLLVFTGVAGATVLTFDDISDDGYGTTIPDGYSGFKWGNMYVLNHSLFPSYLNPGGLANGVVSGNNVVINGYGDQASVLKLGVNSTFNFNGAYFTGAWNNGLNIEVIGSQWGDTLYDKTITVNSFSPTWYAFNYLEITNLTFIASGGTDAGYGLPCRNGVCASVFAMDNFTINQSVPNQSVPEPATFLLFGASMAGIGILRKRFEALCH